MAARGIGRIARLTLFSGPQCSLCDTAKAELAKVRQQRPFELETVNIQDAGQERWKRKYVYWIPALHVEGKEVAKGRWDAQTVHKALDSWEASPWTRKDKEYVQQWLYGTPLYDRVHEEDVLGEERVDEEDAPGVHVQRCFNCGEPGHVVSACTQPVDRRLVALSRQYFEFFRKDPGPPRLRVHEVEEWRRERLEWLDAFDPGQVRGPLLREALGLRDGDTGERVEWLPNIANWGYPPGWVGSCDPRERVWQRITDASPPEDDDADEEPLYIFADGDPEVCDVSRHAAMDSRSGTPSISDEDEKRSASYADPPSRWATYPDTYFLWSRLPVITTSPSHHSRGASVPPWRTLQGFSEVRPSVHPMSQPPQPMSIPPPPPSSPPPLPLVGGPSSLSCCPPSVLSHNEDEADMEESDINDMDLSDQPL
ncbi:hypothetical protein V8D89_015878 [Ganoderma adspersum]